jgi:menaquinone-dependent protoporphyrinogen IX oxidase
MPKTLWIFTTMYGPTMDNSSYIQNFDLGKKNEIHHHSKIEHLKISKFAKLVANEEVRRYTSAKFANFVLRKGKCTTFGPKRA